MTESSHQFPKLTQSGSFDPVELDEFLDACAKNNVPHYRMAEHLGVSLHRVIYAAGLGREAFRRRAAVARIIRAAGV